MSFNILCFCGGGIRGYFSSLVLQRIYEKQEGVLNNANMLAGTSTGGLIISDLISGKAPDQIPDTYETLQKVLIATNSLPESYDQTKPVASTKKLFDTFYLKHGDLTLDDYQKHKLLLTSFDLGSGDDTSVSRPWGPVLFNNLEKSDNGSTNLALSIAATSSMPGANAPLNQSMTGSVPFPPGLTNLVDGAFAHHDPTMLAVSLAIENGYALSDIKVVCIDTLFFPSMVNPYDGDAPWGGQQWTTSTGPYIQSLLRNTQCNPAFGLFMNGNTATTIPDMSARMLGDNYVHLQQPSNTFIPEFSGSEEHMIVMKNLAESLDISAALDLVSSW